MQIAPFKLEQFFEKYEFNTEYMFGSSDAETHSVKELLTLADSESLDLWNNLKLGYTETHGLPLLRNEIAKLYDKKINAENILVCCGAEEAVYACIQTILKPTSHVVVITPCYQSLKTLPIHLGAQVTEVKLDPNQQWKLNISDLENAVRDNTDLILINFPHNPTSYLADHETYSKIIQIAKSANAYLFSDEVYRFSEQRIKDRLPAAADCYEKALSLGVMSKSFGLPGLRIGWLATQDKELLEKIARYKNYLTICSSATSEVLSLIALRAKEKILERNIKIIHENLKLLNAFFENHHELFQWHQPIAGVTAFPKLNHKISIDDFSVELIKKKGVMILPGSVYDQPGNYFRIGFGRKNMAIALEKFSEFVKEL